MNYKDEYKRWCESERTEPALKAELLSLKDEQSIEDRFYRSLEFGTAGLRGILGAGTNRMNLHTVRQATKGLSDYIKTIDGADKKGVVIAYDSRMMSKEFAHAAAGVLCKCGIKTYLFGELHPVPMLSFAVRHLNCTAGIVITASHNPPEYNGYKVYWSDGGQITPEMCRPITQSIEKTDVLQVEYMPEAEALSKGLLEYVSSDTDEAYYKYTMSLSVHDELTDEQKSDITAVYTPLHGSGLVPVTQILKRMGYANVYVVEEQKLPDGAFPTVKAPNPENRAAFDLALELAKKKHADIALATDPDSDRLGVCIADGRGGYTALTGNCIGSLLIRYILESLYEKKAIPKDAFAVESIVSTRLAEKICESYGVEMRRVLTGFRYIAEQIENSEKNSNGTFLFGFEESYGFLAGTKVRDKDACLAAMLMCEACAYYKAHGKSLSDVLADTEKMYGAYAEKCISFNVSGKDGMAKLADYMKNLHDKPMTEIAGSRITRCTDYEKGTVTNFDSGSESKTTLPKANVISYDLGESVWVCMRPSGTEPKLKIYVGVCGKTKKEAEEQAQSICDTLSEQTQRLLK